MWTYALESDNNNDTWREWKLNKWLWDLSGKQSLEILMVAYLLKCEEESHTKEDVGWKWVGEKSI